MPTSTDPYFSADGVTPLAPPDYTSDMRAIMADYQEEMQQRVAATLADFQYQWQPVQAALNLQIHQLQVQMAAAEAAGQPLTVAWLQEAQRLAALKSAVQGNVQQFAAGIQQQLGAAQQQAAQLGVSAAQQALAASVPPGMSYTFGVPPQSVLAQMAGAIQPESPLYALFEGYGAEAAERAAQALFTSVALGEGPRVAAQRLQWATNMSAQRAEVIARTEIMRTWRGAQLANYRANSDVVSQWMWSCDFGPRSCSACIAMDGTYHPLEEELDDHICGRCSALPITRPWSEILGAAGVSSEGIQETSLAEQPFPGGMTTGADWLAQQPVEIQNQIMGPAKAEAWRQGAFDLRDVVGLQQDTAWGASIVERSMRDMGLDAQRWLREARANANGSSVASAEQIATATEGTPSALASTDASTTRPLGDAGADAGAAAASESPVWQQIADTLQEPSGDVVELQPFSLDPQPFAALQAEEKRLTELLVINPERDSKARIAQELATRLQDNPAFAALPQRIVDNYLNDLRATGYMEQDVAHIAKQFSTPPTMEEATSLLLHAWADGKGTLIAALQQAVEDEFGLSNTYARFSEDALAQSQAVFGDAEARAGLQAFAREMYNNTQDYLAEQGITEVTLYRGMVFTELPAGLDFAALDGAGEGGVQTITLALQPASSFTSRPETAALFGNLSVMGASFNTATGEIEGLGQYRFLSAARVPATDVLGTAMSGFGARGEAEFVVLGGEYELRAVGQFVENPMAAEGALTANDVRNLMASDPRISRTALRRMWQRLLRQAQEEQ